MAAIRAIGAVAVAIGAFGANEPHFGLSAMPLASYGPVSGVVGVLLAFVGMAAIDATVGAESRRDTVWLAGVAAIGLYAAAQHFVTHPPVNDGAFNQMRHGNEEVYPASPFMHVIAFAPWAWATYLAIVPFLYRDARTRELPPIRRVLASACALLLAAFALDHVFTKIFERDVALVAARGLVVAGAASCVFVRHTRVALVFAIVAFTAGGLAYAGLDIVERAFARGAY